MSWTKRSSFRLSMYGLEVRYFFCVCVLCDFCVCLSFVIVAVLLDYVSGMVRRFLIIFCRNKLSHRLFFEEGFSKSLFYFHKQGILLNIFLLMIVQILLV